MFKVSKSGYSAIAAQRATSVARPSVAKRELGTVSKNKAFDDEGKMVSTSAPSMNVPTSPNTTVSGNNITIDMEPMLTGLTPQSETILHKLYRDIYYNEAVSGCAVDLISTLPFSEFSLGGIATHKGDMRAVHRVYQETLERLNLRTLLPEMSVDYLVLGKHCSSLLYNREKRTFTDVLPHKPENLKIESLPFYSQDPIISVKFPEEVTEILRRTNSPRVGRIREHLGAAVIDKILTGDMELDPLSTIFIPRRTFSTSDTGTSYLRRVMPIYLIEKNLYRGTLIESARRQRGILHLTLGDGDQWNPTVQDLEFMTELFMGADSDPLGAIIATRTGIAVEEYRQGGDFWKSTDFTDSVLSHKLRALGISEAFLTGDATYACVIGSTYIPTEHGLLQIGNIADRRDGKVQTFSPLVNSRYGRERCAKWLYQGKAPVVEVMTKSGASLTGTKNHRLVRLTGLDDDWAKIRDLDLGDYVAIQTKACTRSTKLPLGLSDPIKVKKGVRLYVTKPNIMTPDLAYIIGAVLSEGGVGKSRIAVSNCDQKFIARFCECVKSVFDVDPCVYFKDPAGTSGKINGKAFVTNLDYYKVHINSKTVVQWFKELGCVGHSYTKRVPDCILQADKESQVAFLAAYFEGDGHVHKTTGRISWKSKSVDILAGIHAIVQSFGLNAKVGSESVILYSVDSAELYTDLKKYLVTKSFDYEAKTFKNANQFGIPSKFVRDLLKARMQYFNRHSSFLLNDDGDLIQIRGKARFGDKLFLYDAFDTGKYDTFLEQLEQISKSTHTKLMELYKLRYNWVPITALTDRGIQDVYDLSMHAGVEPAYVANGFISHNTSDAALSVFIDTIRSFRDMMTRKLFYNKLFPLISLINGFTVRGGKLSIQENLISQITSEEALSQLNDNSKLLIPSVHWHKQLKPEGDSQYIDLLNTLTEKGVPVPLRALAAAGGMDLDTLIRQQDEDIDIRKRVSEYQKKIAELTPKSAEAGDSMSSASSEMLRQRELLALTSADPTGKYKSSVLAERGRLPILKRDFSHAEPYQLSKTDKPLPVRNRPAFERRANDKIIKTLRSKRN